MHGIISTNSCTLLWNEHVTSVVFIDVRIGMIIIHQQYYTIYMILLFVLPCALLWLCTSQ